MISKYCSFIFLAELLLTSQLALKNLINNDFAKEIELSKDKKLKFPMNM